MKPGFPEVLGLPDPTIPAPRSRARRSSGRRTVLADWIASKDNPLTARVFVNRVWQYHFGRGHRAHRRTTSASSANSRRTRSCSTGWPSDFMDGGWKLKRLHKLIMMSSVVPALGAGRRRQPEGRPGERAAVAVQHAAAHGRGGPRLDPGRERLAEPQAVRAEHYPKIPKEVLAGQSVPGQGWPTSPPEEATGAACTPTSSGRSACRSWSASTSPTRTRVARCGTSPPCRRSRSGLLNGEFANEQAAAFAKRLQKEAPDDLAAQVTRAIRLTTGRVPTADEVKKDVAFVAATEGEAQARRREGA